jgi:decaprenyl-phosphate phosphoribosyltransferase
MEKLKHILTVIRPRQWIKNSLLLLAFLTSNLSFTPKNILLLSGGIIVFSLASSLGYVTNDWLDRKIDKSHPKKGKRGFAAGNLDFKDYVFLTVALASLVLYLSSFLPRNFRLTVFAYLIVTLLYSLWIKHIPVLEMLWLSLGFLLRALSGAYLFPIPITHWFLLVTAFGSVFIVSTKRFAELIRNDEFAKRQVLTSYSRDFLQSVSTVSLSVTLSVFGLWAVEVSNTNMYALISLFPITLAFLRYLWHRDRGHAETPEELLIGDWVFMVCGITAAVLIWMAVPK